LSAQLADSYYFPVLPPSLTLSWSKPVKTADSVFLSGRIPVMIVRPHHHWFRRLFIWHGSVLSKIMFRLSLNLMMSLFAVYAATWLAQHGMLLTLTPFSLLGVAIAIALGFRNNASYARFVEARTLWGCLLITHRSLLRQLKSLFPADEENLAPFIALQLAFTYSLKHQLRGSDARTDMKRLLPAELAQQISQQHGSSNQLLLLMGQWIGQRRSSGQISDILFQLLDANLNQLSTIQGGCERIANTPIPYAYTLILHRTVYLFCTLLPFALVSELHYMTMLVSVFVSYTLISLESLAEELEHPFGGDANDLPLNAISNRIEIDLREMNNEGLLPARLRPDQYYQLN
jgi:putative membrane protein